MICVPDLERGIEAYTRIGFAIYPGGAHTGRATHNAIAFQQDDYLELLSLRDRDAPVAPGSPDARLADFLARGGGFRYVALQSDDLAADVAAMRRRGVDVSDPAAGARRAPSGQELRWLAASLGAGNPLPIFFVPDLPPRRSRGAAPGRSRCYTARAAWMPPRAGWKVTACPLRCAACATRASRRCWSGRSRRAAPTSASWAQHSLVRAAARTADRRRESSFWARRAA